MINAIVAEFNPFHNGHKYIIDKCKRNNGTVVSIMSGNFVQRGDIAIMDKYSRAMVSLNNGVDLVIELPVPYVLSNAQTFGTVGVEIAKELGIVDNLVFGSECGDITKMTRCIDCLENIKVQNRIKELMSLGEYYPRAVSISIGEIYGKEMADIIEKPNNILGIEYIKALQGSNINPVTFSRKLVDHNSLIENNAFASATLIRDKIINNGDYSQLLPDYAIDNYAVIDNIEQAILYKFKTMSKKDIRFLPDVNEGLENRIKDCADCCNTLGEMLLMLKTKRYTMARLRRILCCGVLEITKEIQGLPLSYIRVLGFSERGSDLLKAIKQNSKIPVITNVSKGYSELNDTAKKVFDIDMLATKLWYLASNQKGKTITDFENPIVKV